jgi:hypothetical protein
VGGTEHQRPVCRVICTLTGSFNASKRDFVRYTDKFSLTAERGHSGTGRSPHEKPRAGDHLRDRALSAPEASLSSSASRVSWRFTFWGCAEAAAGTLPLIGRCRAACASQASRAAPPTFTVPGRESVFEGRIGP